MTSQDLQNLQDTETFGSLQMIRRPATVKKSAMSIFSSMARLWRLNQIAQTRRTLGSIHGSPRTTTKEAGKVRSLQFRVHFQTSHFQPRSIFTELFLTSQLLQQNSYQQVNLVSSDWIKKYWCKIRTRFNQSHLWMEASCFKTVKLSFHQWSKYAESHISSTHLLANASLARVKTMELPNLNKQNASVAPKCGFKWLPLSKMSPSNQSNIKQLSSCVRTLSKSIVMNKQKLQGQKLKLKKLHD